MPRQAGRRSAPRLSLRKRLRERLRERLAFDSTVWLTVGLVAVLVCAGAVVMVSHLMSTYGGEDDLAADVSRAGARVAGPAAGPPDVYPPAPAEKIYPLSPAKQMAVLRKQARQATQVLKKDMAARGLVPVDESDIAPTTFTVSSFNVLGAGHTVGRGARAGYANGVTRMRAAAGLISGNGVSVVGLQEFQSPQYQTFEATLGGAYDVWPGLALGQAPVQNSIAWRTADWTMVDNGTLPIPYFGGNAVAMPHVLLRNLHTGQEVWFANYHNPADAHGPAQRWREAATAMQVNLVQQLTADGTPMVITGDMNERDGYACRLTGGAPTMHSADGARTDGSCYLPSRMNVDWIFGSSDIEFTDFYADFAPKTRRISDHPMVRSTATVAPAVDTKGCVRAKATGQLFCPPPS